MRPPAEAVVPCPERLSSERSQERRTPRPPCTLGPMSTATLRPFPSLPQGLMDAVDKLARASAALLSRAPTPPPVDRAREQLSTAAVLALTRFKETSDEVTAALTELEDALHVADASMQELRSIPYNDPHGMTLGGEKTWHALRAIHVPADKAVAAIDRHVDALTQLDRFGPELNRVAPWLTLPDASLRERYARFRTTVAPAREATERARQIFVQLAAREFTVDNAELIHRLARRP